MMDFGKVSSFHYNWKTIISVTTILLFSSFCTTGIHCALNSRVIVVTAESDLFDLEAKVNTKSVMVTSDSTKTSLIQAEDTIETAYAGCNGGDGVKVCYGDTASCVGSRSCSHMSALIKTSTHLNIMLYTKCGVDYSQPVPDSFQSMTLHDTLLITRDEETGDVAVTCDPLERKNIKLFNLWPKYQQKCDPGTTHYTVGLSTFSDDGINLDKHQEDCNTKHQNSTGSEIPQIFDFVYWHENFMQISISSNAFINLTYSEIKEMVDYRNVDSEDIFYISVPVPTPIPTTSTENDDSNNQSTTENIALGLRSYFSFVSISLAFLCISNMLFQ